MLSKNIELYIISNIIIGNIRYIYLYILPILYTSPIPTG